MRISSILYSLRQGLKNIRRNLLFSLASIGTMISCLFLFGIFYCIIANFSSYMNEMKNSIKICAYFEENIPEENINLIGEQIRYRDEVKTIEYVSAEQAWEEYAKDVYQDKYEEAMEIFADDNPLSACAHYKITLKDIDDQAEFANYLSGLQGIRKVSISEEVTKGISAMSKIVGYISIGIIVILLLVSVFLISNTVVIGITVRKEEIAIMKLIGATNFFVRAPFIVEGAVIGLIGSTTPLILVFLLYDNVLKIIQERCTDFTKGFEFISQSDIFKVLIPVSIVIGIGIGLVGSILSTRKHLKV